MIHIRLRRNTNYKALNVRLHRKYYIMRKCVYHKKLFIIKSLIKSYATKITFYFELQF